MSISVCLAAKLIINPQHPATNFTDISINITPIGLIGLISPIRLIWPIRLIRPNKTNEPNKPNGPARPIGHLAKAANSPAKRRLRHAKTPLPAKRKATSDPSPAPGAGKAKRNINI